jgi:hypothetical protein
MWGEDVGESTPLVRGLSNRGRSEIVHSLHVFGGGGRTTGRDPFLKARQRAEAATPEAPRTRRTIRHAQRGASFCNKG